MNRMSRNIDSYYPELVIKLLDRLQGTDLFPWLVGFGEEQKWLARILSETHQDFELCDWRPEFLGYDLCDKVVKPLTDVTPNSALVLCLESFNEVSSFIRFVVDSKLSHVPVIIECTHPYSPFEQVPKYAAIAAKARKRALSLNSFDALFNVVQLVRETRNVEGELLECGTFSGGTAAFILETMKAWEINKGLWLLDSFSGLPVSPLGVDHRWAHQFMNVSFSEVKARFSDSQNVHILKGNIRDTLRQIDFPLSFVHIDIDTLDGARLATDKIWPLLSRGGCLLFDDYGFLPNCYPLTVFVDDFVRSHESAFCFGFSSGGYFIMKR